jgi:hypothetical protein
MTAQLMTGSSLDLAADDQFAETVGDAALAALLRTKPRDEQVPSAVWWLIAETLRTSVTIRRAVNGSPGADTDELPMLVTEARLLTDAALAELAETTGVRPTPIAVPSQPGFGEAANSPTRPSFGLQLSVLFLARMMVSHRATSPQRLANTLAAHLRALTALKPTPAGSAA